MSKPIECFLSGLKITYRIDRLVRFMKLVKIEYGEMLPKDLKEGILSELYNIDTLVAASGECMDEENYRNLRDTIKYVKDALAKRGELLPQYLESCIAKKAGD